jgi:hypothetical protein
MIVIPPVTSSCNLSSITEASFKGNGSLLASKLWVFVTFLGSVEMIWTKNGISIKRTMNLCDIGEKDRDMDSIVKCSDCECYPEECKNSNSPQTCPNCLWNECCCWTFLHER